MKLQQFFRYIANKGKMPKFTRAITHAQKQYAQVSRLKLQQFLRYFADKVKMPKGP